MSSLLRKWLGLVAVGALAFVPSATSAWNLANTGMRAVLIQTEDTYCQNLDGAGADGAKNEFCWSGPASVPPTLPIPYACCTDYEAGSCDGDNVLIGFGGDGVTNNSCAAPGSPHPCCTGFQTGTCNADNTGAAARPPGFGTPSAGCETYSADFSDTEGTGFGAADLYGTLTYLGGTVWRIEVPATVYALQLDDALANAGATLLTNSSLKLSIDTAAAPISQVTALHSASIGANPPTPVFYTADASYPGLSVQLFGLPSPVDKPFWGSPSDTDDPSWVSFGVPAPMESQCRAAGTPFGQCTGFLTCPTCSGAWAPGPALMLSCMGAWTLSPASAPLYGPALFGPGIPELAPGAPDFGICDPPFWPTGLGTDPAPGTNFEVQPGYDPGTETLVAFTASRTFVPLVGLNATAPVFAALDWRILETADTDADLIPDSFDLDDDADGVMDMSDNCRLIANGPTPLDKTCDTDQDGYGNRCDCDYDNAGGCTITDFNAFRTAFQDLTPPIDAGAGLEADSDCDGDVDLFDFNNFRSGFQSATGTLDSGLSCAGSVPCP